MKVILLDNVKDTGKRGQIVTVADGLARNKLIPLKKAAEATPANIAKYKDLAIQATASSDNGKTEQAIIDALTGISISVSGKSDDHGSLYKSIHESDIIKEIHKALPKNITSAINQKNIIIPSPIKKIGEHPVVLFNKFTITVSVTNK